jgi:hypothetical protein
MSSSASVAADGDSEVLEADQQATHSALHYAVAQMCENGVLPFS